MSYMLLGDACYDFTSAIVYDTLLIHTVYITVTWDSKHITDYMGGWESIQSI